MNVTPVLNRVSENVWNKNNISKEEVEKELRQIEGDFRLPEGHGLFDSTGEYWRPLIKLSAVFEKAIEAIDSSTSSSIFEKILNLREKFRELWMEKRVGLIENHKDLKGVADRIKELMKILAETKITVRCKKRYTREIEKNMSEDERRLYNILCFNAHIAPFVEETKHGKYMPLKSDWLKAVNLEGIKLLEIIDGKKDCLFSLKSKTMEVVALEVRPKEKLDIGLRKEEFLKIREKCPKLEFLITSRKKSIIVRICSIVFNPFNLIRWIWGKIRCVEFAHFEYLVYYDKEGCGNIGDLAATSRMESVQKIEQVFKKRPQKFDVVYYKNFAT